MPSPMCFRNSAWARPGLASARGGGSVSRCRVARPSLPPDLTAPPTAESVALETALAVVAAGVAVAVDRRPRGSVVAGATVVSESRVAGRGLYAARPLAEGEEIGRYPGRIRTAAEMKRKSAEVPSSMAYVFCTEEYFYLDPTDSTGAPSELHGLLGGWAPPWPLPIPVDLAYINEPPLGVGGPSVDFVDKGGGDVRVVALRPIDAGEELFVDYGPRYDRSSYGPPR